MILKPIYLLFAGAGTLTITLLSQTPSAQLKAHTEKLKSAATIHIVANIQPLDGAAVEHDLMLSKPNMFRIENASTLIVSNGKTVWNYDKTSKIYTEEPAQENAAIHAFQGVNNWVWSAFFDPKFSETIVSTRAGATRNLKGNAVKEILVTQNRMSNTAVTIYFDEKLGMGRGALLKSEADGKVISTLVLASKIEPEVSAEAFTFTVPAGASKKEKPALGDKVSFSEVQKILTTSCAPCHTQESKAGLNVSTYESLMRGRRGNPVIVAGDSKSSSIFQNLTGRRQQMPPGGRLPEATISTIARWVDQGAAKD